MTVPWHPDVNTRVTVRQQANLLAGRVLALEEVPEVVVGALPSVVASVSAVAAPKGVPETSPTITLSQKPPGVVEVTVGIDRGVVSPALLVFTPDNWGTPRFITVALPEVDETTVVTVTASALHHNPAKIQYTVTAGDGVVEGGLMTGKNLTLYRVGQHTLSLIHI